MSLTLSMMENSSSYECFHNLHVISIVSLVQEQYVFLHQAVMEALSCGNTEVAPQDLRITMNKLTRTKKSSKQTGYEQEFKVLNSSSFSLMFFFFLSHLLVFFF